MNPDCKNNLIIAGDLNAAPYEPCIGAIKEAGLKDAFEANEIIKDGTFHDFTGKPAVRIDYVFVGTQKKIGHDSDRTI